jgi:chemotaxis protein methyltransferase CheR
VSRRRFGAGGFEAVLSGDEYRLIRDIVSQRLGIWFGPESRLSLERRLRERLTVRGLTSYGDYYHLLKYSPLANEEWEEASEVLTTHETYFYREDYQLRAFKNELLPMLAERGKQRRRLHVWSAGCSTGEEVYTIAILVLESGLFEGWEVRVYGSDLSKKCIQVARRGVYGPTSFRTTSDESKRAWFVPSSKQDSTGPEVLGVSPSVRALCHFGKMNLLDEERTHLVGRCDVIFCRNVLIYFDGPSRKRVIEMFHDRLVEGGVLLLGHAESLLNVSTAFELLHLNEDLVYRKPTLVSAGRDP